MKKQILDEETLLKVENTNTECITQKGERITREKSGCITKFFAIFGVMLSVLFLLNLTAGIVEIPDNLPVIGNLDEIAATTFLLTCLSYLGVNIIPGRYKRR